MKYARRGLLSVLVALVPVAAYAQATPAPAAPAPLSDKTKAKTAKQYVDAGLAAQNTGDYATAITFYTKAYELVPHPVLIFNIAQATRLAGHLDEALNLYAKYLAEDPSGPQAQTARDIVAEINAHRAYEARQAEEARQLAASRNPPAEPARAGRPAPSAPGTPTPSPSASPSASAPTALAASAAPSASLTADVAPADELAPGRTMRIAGIATGAVGVVGIGIGIGFALHSRTLNGDIEHHYLKSTQDAGNRANTIAYAGTIGGGALIAAGVTLYLLGHRTSERLAIAPLVSPQLAGLAVSGRLP